MERNYTKSGNVRKDTLVQGLILYWSEMVRCLNFTLFNSIIYNTEVLCYKKVNTIERRKINHD